jgi:hypothetical protein
MAKFGRYVRVAIQRAVGKNGRKASKKAGRQLNKIDAVRVLLNSNQRTINRINDAYNVTETVVNLGDVFNFNVETGRMGINNIERLNTKSLAFQAFERANKKMAKSGKTAGLSALGGSRKEVFGKELTKAGRRYNTLALRLKQSQENGIKQLRLVKKVEEGVLVGGLATIAAVDFTRYANRRKNTINVAGKQLYDKSGRLGKVKDGYKMVYGKLRRVRGN